MDFVHPVQAVIPGAQGRVLAVLANTSAELSLSTLARLADVSVAQVSRLMPRLVELGLVERREVPPSSLFRLVREHVATQAVLELAGVRSTALRQLREAASTITPEPLSVVVFGSFARGEADSESDIDVVIVRAETDDGDDERWSDSLESWRRRARGITGSNIEVLETSAREAAGKLRGRSDLWRDIRRDGVVIYGAELDQVDG